MSTKNSPELIIAQLVISNMVARSQRWGRPRSFDYTPTLEILTPTPTPAQSFNSDSNSRGFDSDSQLQGFQLRLPGIIKDLCQYVKKNINVPVTWIWSR